MKPGDTGLVRILKATGYSMAGFRAAWTHESAFRQETILLIVMVPLAAWLGRTAPERAMLIATGLLILVVELLNSAVEAVVDRVGTDPHRLSGLAKDLGSAAVLLSLAAVWLTWGLIAWARFA